MYLAAHVAFLQLPPIWFADHKKGLQRVNLHYHLINLIKYLTSYSSIMTANHQIRQDRMVVNSVGCTELDF